MSKETIYNEISKKYHYKNMANYNLLKPFIIWANANTMLDNFYKRPNINLSNSNLDNEIRNIMRHTTGLGLAASEHVGWAKMNCPPFIKYLGGYAYALPTLHYYK